MNETTSKVNTQKVESILGSPELRWLVQGLHRRYERGGNKLGRFALPPSIRTEEIEALNRLLGKRCASNIRSIALVDIESVLIRSGIPSLRHAVEVLEGPCVDRREKHQRSEENWKSVFSEARKRLAGQGTLLSFLDELNRSGLLRRFSRSDSEQGRSLLSQAISIGLELPASGISLAELAASQTGDAHALDPDAGTGLSTLVLRMASKISGLKGDWNNVENRRAIWESVGVYCDELSASVLVLNLFADRSSLSGKSLIAYADLGEPCRLTLRTLIRHPPDFTSVQGLGLISVCENPSVLAAVADQLGPCSKPLLCIEGNFRTPAARLLRTLTQCGVAIRYHGDFDWEGVRIANRVMNRFGAQPWRMSAQDYRQAKIQGKKLWGQPVTAEWDPRLTRSMIELGRSVHEEAVLDTLYQDLEN